MKNLYYLFILSFLLFSCEEEVPPVTYTLTTQVTPEGAGTITPSSGTYDEGESVTISATSSANYNFKQWTGTGSGTVNPLTFKIISNTNITAEFELIDADNDGVTDALDKCPDTPAGTAVSSEGCATSQLDTDGDGITNDKDQCSGTPDGESVDANGCSESQKDTDGDGVTDDIDTCPDTPDGENVDVNGCSDSQKDTDGDGVTDDKDQCSGTPDGESVDANGCSDSQKDTDGDGVTDDKDQCSGTPDGESVDANGCSDSQIPSYIPLEGLLSWYPFNNGITSDLSVNNNDGSIYGGVTSSSDRFGNSNSSYYFPGAQNSYIEVDHNTSFKNIVDGFTLSVWYTYENTIMNSRLIEIGNPDNNQKGFTLNVNKDSRKWSGYIINGDNTNLVGIGVAVPEDPVQPDTWTHLVLTFNFITGESKTYVNGVKVKEKNDDNYSNYFGSFDLSDRDFNIGRKTESAYDPWKGEIDDIGIWKRALSIDEIEKIYELSKN